MDRLLIKNPSDRGDRERIRKALKYFEENQAEMPKGLKEHQPPIQAIRRKESVINKNENESGETRIGLCRRLGSYAIAETSNFRVETPEDPLAELDNKERNQYLDNLENNLIQQMEANLIEMKRLRELRDIYNNPDN